MSADGRISADHFSIKENTITTVLNEREIDMLREMGFGMKIGQSTLEEAEQAKKEVIDSRPLMEADGLLSVSIDRYLDTQGILSKYDSLHNEFSGITQIVDLPHETSGYDGSNASLRGPSKVKLFRINTNQNKPKPGMMLITGIHAREWVPPLAGIVFVEHILRSYSSGSSGKAEEEAKKILEGLDIFIIPALNPDGINYSHYDYADWRKNRTPASEDPCKGVDNNRNFSIFWGQGGSSNNPCDDIYHGISALSEPENQNVVYVLDQFPNILTAVDCHSFGEAIYRPQLTGGTFIPSEPVTKEDNEVYLKLESSMNSAISSISPSKVYSTGSTSNHAGTSDEYLYFARHIFGFDLECVKEKFRPQLPDALIATKEVSAALTALALEAISLNPIR